MNRKVSATWLGVLLSILLALSPTAALAQSGSSNTPVVTVSPSGVVFDGASIWVLNNECGEVTKLRASDGFNLGHFFMKTGQGALAFDGANIWVTNSGLSGTVVKLNASDGENLGTITVGSNPRGIAFDGANIWVANSASGSVSKRPIR